jgi:phosphoglycolate phosphatase
MAYLLAGDRKVRIEGILFDKDGTLLDFMSLWGAWAQSVHDSLAGYVSLKSSFSLDDLLGTVSDGEGNIVSHDPKGPLTMASPEEMGAIIAWRLYYEGHSWNDSLTLARRFFQAADAHVEEQRGAKPIHGLPEFLGQCRAQGLKLAVVTSDHTASAVKHLEWMNIRDYFEHVIGDDQVKHGKPHPEMIGEACARLGLVPSQTVMIGDANGDMQMGKRGGVALTVGIASGPEVRDALRDADIIVGHYHELSLSAE